MANPYLATVKRLYIPFLTVKSTLQYRDIRRIFLASLAGFSLVYALASGMIFRAPSSLPSNSLIEADLITGWPLGVYPWVTIILGGTVVFSVNLTAATFLVLLSLLFASNISLFMYVRRYAGNCCSYDSKTTMASIVPSMFSTFACCGGGLTLTLFSYIFSLGIGSAYAAVVITRGWILALISLVLLYWNLYKISSLIRQPIPSNMGLRFTLRSSK